MTELRRWQIPLPPPLFKKGDKLVFCLKGQPEDGARLEGWEPQAPKEIPDSRIAAFYCRFSAVDIPQEDSLLSGKHYRLQADEKGGTYCAWDREQYRKTVRFTPDEAFMAALQGWVTTHQIAKFNGYFARVSGLPDLYGAQLEIRYASGQTIQASDNQDCFLPLKAMEDLEAIFLKNLNHKKG